MAKTQNGQTTGDILTEEQIAELHQQLLEEKERIAALYTHDLKAGKESHAEDSDDLVDRANNAYNREFLFSLSSTERDQLLEIDRALKRLEAGTYGFCLHSGEPITLPRLRAVPWARYTAPIQEKAEKGLLEDDALD